MSLPDAPTLTVLLLAPMTQETTSFVAVLETVAQRVLWTESIDEALHLAQTWRPDLVLVDVATPNGVTDGCRRLLTWRATADDQFCPVALVAPRVDAEMDQLAHLGVDDVVWRTASAEEVRLRLALLTRLGQRYDSLAHRTREAQASLRQERSLRRRAEALEAMTAAALADGNPRTVGQRLMNSMVSTLRADGGIVYIVDSSDAQLRVAHAVGSDDFLRLAGRGALERIVRRVIDSGRTRQLIVEDDTEGEAVTPWVVLAALMQKSPGQGGVVVVTRQGDAFFGSHEMRLFDQMMDRAMRTMTSAQVGERTEHELRVQQQVVRELHHRVRNNLQAMSALLSFQLMTRASSSTAVTGTLRRIRGMAAIQDMTFQYPGETIPLAAIVQQAVAQYAASRVDGQQVDVALDLDDVGLTAERAQVVGLVLEELMSNASEHGLRGGPGVIRLCVKAGEDGVTVSVEDTGCNLSTDFCIEALSGSGLHLARLLLQREFRSALTVVADADVTRLSFTAPWEYVARTADDGRDHVSSVAPYGGLDHDGNC